MKKLLAALTLIFCCGFALPACAATKTINLSYSISDYAGLDHVQVYYDSGIPACATPDIGVPVGDGYDTSCVADLPYGRHDFTITVVTPDGIESLPSASVSVVVRPGLPVILRFEVK